MHAIEILSAQSWVSRLGWTLIHFLWQGALIAALYVVARSRIRNSRFRYVLACAALAAMAIAPVVTFALSRVADSLPVTPSFSAAPVTSFRSSPVTLPVTLADSATHDDVMPWLVVAWFAGAIIFWIRLIGGWMIAARMRSMLVHPAPGEWQGKLDRLRMRVAVSRPVRLLVSALVQTPTVVGWLRPVVLMPIGALAGLPAEHVEALLAHELAHIRRHDYLVSLLQGVVESLLFYHPAIWWVSRQIRNERELCCDDIAVSIGGDTLIYARALADLEAHRPAHFNPALAANGGSLRNRIARLLGMPGPMGASIPASGAMVCAAIILATAFAAFGQPDTGAAAFDVAAIRHSADRADGSGIMQPPLHGALTVRNMTLEYLIQAAWSFKRSEQVVVPARLKSSAGLHYDIDAKGDPAASRDQIMLMLRALLVSRFHLTFHFEKRDAPVFALVLDKSGPKGLRAPEPGEGKGMDLDSKNTLGGQHWIFHDSPIDSLAGLLSVPGLPRPVVDMTGLKGGFDFTFVDPLWDRTKGTLAEHMLNEVFPEVQNQLGLRVQAQTAPMDALVVDGLDKTPTEN